MIDPITEGDLSAYVDGELDLTRRVEVEAHLARHPQDAARVMADLRDRDLLCEAFLRPQDSHSVPLRSSARRLDRSLAWQRVNARLRRAAMIALLVGAGWIAHTEIGTFGVPDSFASPADPALVEEAEQARQAVQVRARTHSQRPIPSYDRTDLEAATGLSLPELPADWTVRDVQVFPARQGPGVEVAIQAGRFGDLALFAMRRPPQVSSSNALALSPDGATVYWQAGQTAYALSGAGGQVNVDAAAAKLSLKH